MTTRRTYRAPADPATGQNARALPAPPWFPVEERRWQAAADALAGVLRWPRALAEIDLRSIANRALMLGATLPTAASLAERWGWSERAVRRLRDAIAAWAIPEHVPGLAALGWGSAGSAPEQRRNSAGTAPDPTEDEGAFSDDSAGTAPEQRRNSAGTAPDRLSKPAKEADYSAPKNKNKNKNNILLTPDAEPPRADGEEGIDLRGETGDAPPAPSSLDSAEDRVGATPAPPVPPPPPPPAPAALARQTATAAPVVLGGHLPPAPPSESPEDRRGRLTGAVYAQWRAHHPTATAYPTPATLGLIADRIRETLAGRPGLSPAGAAQMTIDVIDWMEVAPDAEFWRGGGRGGPERKLCAAASTAFAAGRWEDRLVAAAEWVAAGRPRAGGIDLAAEEEWAWALFERFALIGLPADPEIHADAARAAAFRRAADQIAPWYRRSNPRDGGAEWRRKLIAAYRAARVEVAA